MCSINELREELMNFKKIGLDKSNADIRIFDDDMRDKALDTFKEEK